MDAGLLRTKITFQTLGTDQSTWSDYLTCFAYVNGLSGAEMWAANAGGNAESIVNVTVRYDSRLADVIPQTYRIVIPSHDNAVYDIIMPPDNIMFRNAELKFRARRLIS